MIVTTDRHAIKKLGKRCLKLSLHEQGEEWDGKNILVCEYVVYRAAVELGVGWAFLHRWYEWMPQSLWLAVYVTPTERRKGWGTRLYRAATEGYDLSKISYGKTHGPGREFFTAMRLARGPLIQ